MTASTRLSIKSYEPWEWPCSDDSSQHTGCRGSVGSIVCARMKLSHLERKPAGEATATRLAAAEGVTTGRGETASAAAAVHHVEDDVRVDVNVGAVHAAHATHSAHTSHTSHAAETAAAAEHVRWVNEVITIVVSSAFSRTLLDVDP